MHTLLRKVTSHVSEVYNYEVENRSTWTTWGVLTNTIGLYHTFRDRMEGKWDENRKKDDQNIYGQREASWTGIMVSVSIVHSRRMFELHPVQSTNQSTNGALNYSKKSTVEQQQQLIWMRRIAQPIQLPRFLLFPLVGYHSLDLARIWSLLTLVVQCERQSLMKLSHSYLMAIGLTCVQMFVDVREFQAR